jgi:multidrug efflux system outer membrane protein
MNFVSRGFLSLNTPMNANLFRIHKITLQPKIGSCFPKRADRGHALERGTLVVGDDSSPLALSETWLGPISMLRAMSKPLVLSAATLFLGGCVLGPSYSRPEVSVPAGWKEEPSLTQNLSLPEEWWTVFNDCALSALEAQAVAANQDLKRAVARVAEARGIARSSKSERYPGVSAGAAYNWTRNSENRDASPLRRESDDFSSSFDLGYEVDVWGRVRRAIETAQAELGATENDLRVVLLTLTADVAKNYQLLGTFGQERRVLEATIAMRREQVRLQQTRNRAGLINEVDVARANTELASAEAELQIVLRGIAQTEHALAVLCGQPPATFLAPISVGVEALPEIPAGLPAELLLRRPDVVAAEKRLEAANARIGVAKAAFFPTIRLTGSGGYASADLGSLVNWPSRFASVGPSISVPVFQGGRNKANLQAATSRYEQNVAMYRASVLNAFREVEDALSDLSALAAQAKAVERALNSARDTARLAEERYLRGLSSYLEVVDAQRTALQAERQEAQLQGQRVVSTILLAKSLGGGWKTNASGPVKP